MRKYDGKVSKSVLVDAINDKCANYHRVRQPQEGKKVAGGDKNI